MSAAQLCGGSTCSTSGWLADFSLWDSVRFWNLYAKFEAIDSEITMNVFFDGSNAAYGAVKST